MALVPSGRFVGMKTQLYKIADNLSGGVAERDHVQQQQIGGNQAADQSALSGQPSKEDAFVSVEPTLNQPQQTQPQPQDQSVQPMEGQTDQQVDVSNIENEDNSSKTTSMKSYVFKMLQQLGVQPRQLSNVDGQIYGEEIDLDAHTISGHYMIPTFTSQGQIDEKKAQQTAKQIGQQFGLSQKMKIQGRNWRVDFKSAPRQEVQSGGSSFDELHNNNKQKKASTQGEMIKDRRNELYNILRKIARGEKNV
jgi:hypothetical protein